MLHSTAELLQAKQIEIARVANDLEITAATIASLVELAERSLAEETPGIETLVQVTARYAADLTKISQRLLEINKQ
ncbi:hypothetical protein [Herbaspirillum rubrisubalbicans]|uniref:Uncharacterized protein n=1 Tax=Herbaspirillum rubrisubalbicans TaxID=80842 RepID=A0AAD0XG09_9BURK|nr:hypothetical protein [Herbaspirillum rubrisubalbicans]AYR23003.1 hypothetical protein RC54_03840 [Herbaspirillum rubrisubalbicans]